jgi:hypothetical protein
VTKAVIDTGSIPLCAMQVQRESDFTGLSCYAPAEPCGCFFESIATKTTTCEACAKDSECSGATPKCHLYEFHDDQGALNNAGFCEAY